jgi:hypothetical protein
MDRIEFIRILGPEIAKVKMRSANKQSESVSSSCQYARNLHSRSRVTRLNPRCTNSKFRDHIFIRSTLLQVVVSRYGIKYRPLPSQLRPLLLLPAAVPPPLALRQSAALKTRHSLSAYLQTSYSNSKLLGQPILQHDYYTSPPYPSSFHQCLYISQLRRPTPGTHLVLSLFFWFLF